MPPRNYDRTVPVLRLRNLIRADIMQPAQERSRSGRHAGDPVQQRAGIAQAAAAEAALALLPLKDALGRDTSIDAHTPVGPLLEALREHGQAGEIVDRLVQRYAR
jgi:hypothetical protein